MGSASERRRFISNMLNWLAISQKTREMRYEVYGDILVIYDMREC